MDEGFTAPVNNQEASSLVKLGKYEKIISAVTKSVHSSIDINEVYENAVAALINNIANLMSASIIMIETDDAVIKAERGHPEWFMKKLGRIPRPRGYVWKTILDAKPMYTPDTDIDTVIGPAGKEMGIKSYISMPLKGKEGAVIGVINLNSPIKHAFDAAEMQLMEIVATQIEVAIDTAHQASALIESESRFRNMADTTPALLWMSDQDQHCTYFNKGWLDFTGRTMEQELGNGWADSVHPEDLAGALEIYSSAFDARREFKMKYRLLHHTGEYRWLLDQGVPRYMPDGTFAGYIGSCIDITEIKTAGAALEENLTLLEKKNRYDAIIGSVSRSVHKSLELQGVLDNAVESLIENFEGAESAFIYLVEGDEAVLKSHKGIGMVYLAGAERIPRPRGLTWKTLLEGKPIYIPDTDIDPDMGPSGKKAGIKSIILTPIMEKGKAIGTIIISSFTKDAFGEDEFRTLDIVNDQIAIAIQNASQAEALIKSEAEILKSRDELESRVELRTTALKTANDSLIEEINERKRAQKDLMFIQFAIENVSDSAFWIKDSGQIYYANQAACDTLGYTRDELLGKTIIDINMGVTMEMFDELFRRVKEQGVVTFASVHFRKDGTSFPVEINANFMKYEGEEFVCSIVRDITERKRSEEELMKTQKLESLSVFAGGIAHDFNNLLTGIMGNISLAKLSIPKSDKNFGILHEAEKASERARDLTYQLLTFAKGGEPVRQVCNISKLLRESVTFASRGSNVKVDFTIPEDLWHTLIDEGQINQVVYNIVLNAIQAMPHGGNIEVHAQNRAVKPGDDSTLEPGKYVKIRIGDDGVGIPAEILNNIFDPFYTTKQMGSGLGLATSYSIIKRHGGNIEVETTEGEGTVFHFYLPAAAGTASKEESSTQTEVGKMRGKVLIMDDEALIRLALKEMLTYLGYEVTATKDGKEAITAYKDSVESNSKFDAAILDITIPGGMGGKETIQIIKAEIDPDVKAVVSSGYSTSAIIAEYKDYGFIDYLAKPYKVEDLTVVLDRVINS